MPPLTRPADRYRALAADLAYYASTPPRKGRKQERKREIADTRRAMRVAVDAMRAECKAMWAEADGRTRRAVMREMCGSKRERRSKLKAA
jgi:hypothetical protein